MTPHVLLIGTSTTYATLLRFRIGRTAAVDLQRVRTGDVGLRAVRDATTLVVVDLHLPGENGLDTIERLRAQHPSLPLLLLTTTDQRSVLSEALGRGASDIILRGRNDLEQIEWWMQQSGTAAEAPVDSSNGDALLGESPAMQRVFRMIDKVMDSSLAVALLGESGTGKERVATAIHERSARGEGPFVAVNCAAIPHELAESVFFGHEKGSFTGAESQRKGHFEQADGGTLFLDEIGELDVGLQAKLLRAIQNREVQRVGSSASIPFDARILCATNANMQAMLEAGTFREDLYYRLFQFPIRLPPLRERGRDILKLARHFLRQEAMRTPDAPLSFAPATCREMLRYDWPGNVRELQTNVQRALLLAEGASIQPDDMFPNWEGASPSPEPADVSPEAGASTRSFFDIPPHAAPSTPTADPQPVASEQQAASHKDDAYENDAYEDPAPHEDPAQHTTVAMAASEAPHAMARPTQVFSIEAMQEIVPLDEVKLRVTQRAVELCDGNIKQAAEALGVARSTVYRLLNGD